MADTRICEAGGDTSVTHLGFLKLRMVTSNGKMYYPDQ